MLVIILSMSVAVCFVTLVRLLIVGYNALANILWIKSVVWWFVSDLSKSMLKSTINMHFFLSFEILPNKSLSCILNIFMYVPGGL